MAERFRSIERVVGEAVSAESRDEILAALEEQFIRQEFPSMEGVERKKTEDDRLLIEHANRATDDLRSRYSLSPLPIPEKNVHIVPEAHWPRNVTATGIFSVLDQAIVLRDRQSKMERFERLLHEMVHFKSFGALEADVSLHRVREYRLGLLIQEREPGGKDAKRRAPLFENLNEAVTEEVAKRLFEESVDREARYLFSEEHRQTQDVRGKYPDARTLDGGPLFGPETFFAREAEGAGGNRLRLEASDFTYTRSRRVVSALVAKLWERNKERYRDEAAVFEVFVRAMLNGNVLPLARVIEGTFGKGTFRRIGEADRDLERLEALIQAL